MLRNWHNKLKNCHFMIKLALIVIKMSLKFYIVYDPFFKWQNSQCVIIDAILDSNGIKGEKSFRSLVLHYNANLRCVP